MAERWYWCIDAYDVVADRFYRAVYVHAHKPEPMANYSIQSLATQNEVKLLDWMGDDFGANGFNDITSSPVGSVIYGKKDANG